MVFLKEFLENINFEKISTGIQKVFKITQLVKVLFYRTLLNRDYSGYLTLQPSLPFLKKNMYGIDSLQYECLFKCWFHFMAKYCLNAYISSVSHRFMDFFAFSRL